MTTGGHHSAWFWFLSLLSLWTPTALSPPFARARGPDTKYHYITSFLLPSYPLSLSQSSSPHPLHTSALLNHPLTSAAAPHPTPRQHSSRRRLRPRTVRRPRRRSPSTRHLRLRLPPPPTTKKTRRTSEPWPSGSRAEEAVVAARRRCAWRRACAGSCAGATRAVGVGERAWGAELRVEGCGTV